ncbi:DNA methyltransferase [Micromonospora sp. BRA006-A]|nr:DNA methyltransferase [Micromonospora sp. BRA006-A]
MDRTFELVELAGNTRKTSGSYYTPSSLIDCLLDSALDPVIDDAVKRGEMAATAAGQPDPSDAIVSELLGLTVCDPACGSGHFLVAAARRIAKRVAAVRERNPEPTVDAVRHALHEVVVGCIYGVDLNPMAVELAKVSLWMEALEPGKPLSFLDAHVKRGNALIGATPALLKRGIPNEAFKPIEGDDKTIAKGLEKQNSKQRAGQGSLFDLDAGAKVANTVFARDLRRITAAHVDTLTDVRKQASAYRTWKTSAEYARAMRVADAWCAAFVWKKTAAAPRPHVTHGVFRALENPDAKPRRRRRTTKSPGCAGSTGSSTGTWSSRRSSRFRSTDQVSTQQRAGPAALTASWATHRGSASSFRSRSSRSGMRRLRPRRTLPPGRSSYRRAEGRRGPPLAARGVRGGKAEGGRREPLPAQRWPLPAHRSGRHQHLRGLFRNRPNVDGCVRENGRNRSHWHLH